MPSWLYLLLEQALILYIVIWFSMRSWTKDKYRQDRKEWERTHPLMSWEDWKNR